MLVRDSLPGWPKFLLQDEWLLYRYDRPEQEGPWLLSITYSPPTWCKGFGRLEDITPHARLRPLTAEEASQLGMRVPREKLEEVLPTW